MPKLTKKPPKLSRHSSGRAYVTLDGQRIYLGKWNEHATHEAYEKLAELWEVMGGKLPNLAPAPKPGAVTTVTMLCAEYWKHVTETGTERTQRTARLTMKPLRRLFGRSGVDTFCPAHLEQVRAVWVKRKLTRTTIRERTNEIIRIFRFGVTRKIVAPDTWTSLQAVEHLKPRKTEAKEPKHVRRVPLGAVRKVWPHLSKPVRALVLLQWLTGARGGELFNLKATDIDQRTTPWRLKLDEHKTSHHGHERVIEFGPLARRVLRQFIGTGRPLDKPLFSPREANAERKAVNAKGSRREGQKANQRQTSRVIGEAYNKDSYRKAIGRACKRAGVKPWTPHQLRHLALTRLRALFGLEVAQAVSGHAIGSKITERYAEPHKRAAADAMEQAG